MPSRIPLAHFCALLFIALVCVGCSSNSDGRWKVERDQWYEKIKSDPGGSAQEIVRMINFSTSPHIDGYENKIHGQMLSEIKNMAGADWSNLLARARGKSAESSLVLIDAFESGQGFSYSPPAVVFQEGGLSNRSVTLDLSEQPPPTFIP